MIVYYVYGKEGDVSFDIFFDSSDDMCEWLKQYTYKVGDHLEIEVVDESDYNEE